MTQSGRLVGIVLAGGRSSRFGRDKLAEPIDGEPLLWRPIRALASAGCGEVVVVIQPTGDEPPMPRDLWPPVRLVRDHESFGGPLLGSATGLASLDEPAADATALVVGGDQPSLAPAVLAHLAGRIRDGVEAAALADPTGHWRPLPMAIAVAPACRTADDLLAAGERRLRTLAARLDVEVVAYGDWSGLDPTRGTLADIDLRTDLPEDRPTVT